MAWRTLATTWLVLGTLSAACGSSGGGSADSGVGPSSSSAGGAGAVGGAGGGSAGDAAGGSASGGAPDGGSGPTCEDACAHVEVECALSPCPYDCKMPNSACLVGCTAAASCVEIEMLQAPYVSCAGACDAGYLCKACITGPELGCNQQIGACLADAMCKEWSDCALSCGDATCYAACDALHPGAVTLYDAVYACLCGSSCADLCSTAMGLRCG